MDSAAQVPLPTDLLRPFQAFGLFPLSTAGGVVQASVPLRLLSLLHCLLVLAITCASLYFAPDIFDTTNAIGLFVDVLQILIPLLTHLLICAECVLRVPSYRSFWAQFARTLRRTETLRGPLALPLRRLYLRCRLELLLLSLLPLAVELRILWGIRSNFWFYSRLAAELSLVGCRLSYLLLCLHLRLLHWLLQLHQREVRRLADESRAQPLEWQWRRGVATRRLARVQEGTRDVQRLTGLLNHCWRWSLLANLTNNLLCITIAFYWNYRSLYFNNLMFQTESLLVGVPLLLLLLHVSHVCQHSFQPLSGTVHQLTRVLRHPHDHRLHHLRQHLLLQLLGQWPTVSAMQLLTVGFGSLKDIVAAITTYLVIFIQFMPREGASAVNNSTVVH